MHGARKDPRNQESDGKPYRATKANGIRLCEEAHRKDFGSEIGRIYIYYYNNYKTRMTVNDPCWYATDVSLRNGLKIPTSQLSDSAHASTPRWNITSIATTLNFIPTIFREIQ